MQYTVSRLFLILSLIYGLLPQSNETSTINNIQWLPNTRLLAIASSAGVWFWSADNSQLYPLTSHIADVTCIALSPSGELIAIARNNLIDVIDVATGEKIITLGEPVDANPWDLITAIEFSRDESYLASGDANGFVKIWDLSTGQLITERRDHTWEVYDLDFSSNDQTILSVGADGITRGWEIPVWSIETGELLTSIVTFAGVSEEDGNVDGGAWQAVFNSDGTSIITAGAERSYAIQVWDVSSGVSENTIVYWQRNMTSAAFSYDTTLVVTVDETGEINIWDTRSGEIINTIYSTQAVENVSVSFDNQLLAAQTDNNHIVIWNIESGDLIAEINGVSD